MNTGQRIKALRENKGWSQDFLADKAGCGQSIIGNLESGEQQSSKWLPSIAAALGVPAITLTTKKSGALHNEPGISPDVPSFPPDLQSLADDLAALLPEDADVWRAQLRAAAIKARREHHAHARASDQPTTPIIKKTGTE